jgi:hypothetical protein
MKEPKKKKQNKKDKILVRELPCLLEKEKQKQKNERRSRRKWLEEENVTKKQ